MTTTLPSTLPVVSICDPPATPIAPSSRRGFLAAVASAAAIPAAAPVSLLAAPTAPSAPFDPLLHCLRQVQSWDAVLDDLRIEDEEDVAANLEMWRHWADKIVSERPPVTTAAGAVAALNHVLADPDFGDESEKALGNRLTWSLVVAARDYLASTASMLTVRDEGERPANPRAINPLETLPR